MFTAHLRKNYLKLGEKTTSKTCQTRTSQGHMYDVLCGIIITHNNTLVTATSSLSRSNGVEIRRKSSSILSRGVKPTEKAGSLLSDQPRGSEKAAETAIPNS